MAGLNPAFLYNLDIVLSHIVCNVFDLKKYITLKYWLSVLLKFLVPSSTLSLALEADGLAYPTLILALTQCWLGTDIMGGSHFLILLTCMF